MTDDQRPTSPTSAPPPPEIRVTAIRLMAIDNDGSLEWAEKYWDQIQDLEHHHEVPITCDACVREEYLTKARSFINGWNVLASATPLDRTPEDKDTHGEWRKLNGEDQCECGRPCLEGGDWCGECVG